MFLLYNKIGDHMETLLIRFSGAVEKTLDTLVKEGYFATKSEAVRMGILELGKEYLSITGVKEHKAKLEVAFAKKKYSPREIDKKLQKLEAE